MGLGLLETQSLITPEPTRPEFRIQRTWLYPRLQARVLRPWATNTMKRKLLHPEANFNEEILARFDEPAR